MAPAEDSNQSEPQLNRDICPICNFDVSLCYGHVRYNQEIINDSISDDSDDMPDLELDLQN
jgi:hypothetical protein